jgi:hypothetical protein
LVATARQALSATPANAAYDPAEYNPLALVEVGFLRFLESAVLAAKRVAEDPRDDGLGLVAVAEDAARIREWAKTQVSLRPTHAITSAAKTAAEGILEAFEMVLDALSTDRIDLAQQAARTMNRCLRDGGDAVARAQTVCARIARLAEDPDPIAAWMRETAGDNVLGCTTAGKELFFRMTDRSCPTGVGFLAAVTQVVSETIGNPETQWSLVVDHIRVLEQHSGALAVMVADRSFRQRAAEVTHDLWVAARRAVQSTDPSTLREHATDVLALGHLVLEQTLKFHFGVATAASTRQTFEQTQARDVSALIDIGREQGWQTALALGSSDYRNAFAHRDYAIAPHGTLILSPNRRGRYAPEVTVPEAVDVVLRYVEIAQAMQLALYAVVDDLDMSTGSVLPVEMTVPTLMAGLGWSGIDVAVTEREAVICGTLDRPMPVAEMAIISQPFIGIADSLRLTIWSSASDASPSTVLTSLLAFEEWSMAADTDRDAAFVWLLRSTQRNGLPLIDDSQIRQYISKQACVLAGNRDLPYAMVGKQLRVWRTLARRLGMEDLFQAICDMQRLRRCFELGSPIDQSAADAALELASSPVPFFSDYLN